MVEEEVLGGELGEEEGVWVEENEVAEAVGEVEVGGEGEAEGLYFTGDSLSRKARRSGSRSRRGSLFVEGGFEGVEDENQPIAVDVLLLRRTNQSYK